MSDESGEKTEDPSERKLQQAYDRGDVPKSQEFTAFIIMTGAALILLIGENMIAEGLMKSMRGMLANLHQFSLAPGGMNFVYTLVIEIGPYVAFPIIALLFVAIFGASIQHKMVFTAQSMEPKLERISILGGMKRLFGPDAWVLFIKGLVKVSIVTAAVLIVIWPERLYLARSFDWSLGTTTDYINTMVLKVLAGFLVAFAFIAVADTIYQRIKWYNKQKMSLKEVKDEMKDTDGNPEIKAKLRQIRAQRARRRMMQKVPDATVIITNPTHYAIALKFEVGMQAPILLAKGLDNVAFRIRSIADEHKIPIVENPPLARALYKDVELDEEIPAEHYKAVAEIIGYVMRIVQRKWR